MVVRVENNNGGQNVGGPRSGENQGSALGQLRNTFVSYSVEEQVIRAELWWVLKMVHNLLPFILLVNSEHYYPQCTNVIE